MNSGQGMNSGIVLPVHSVIHWPNLSIRSKPDRSLQAESEFRFRRSSSVGKELDLCGGTEMKFTIKLLIVLIVAIAGFTRAQNGKEPSATKTQITAFVNVKVIPMDRERIIENQTVI